MFSVHVKPEEFEKAEITGHFGFVFEKNWAGNSYHYHDDIAFEKLRFQNVFRPYKIAKPAFSNSSGLKSVY